MNNWRNITIDNEKDWPDNTKVLLDPPHEDNRGYIQSLVNYPVKNVSLIFTESNCVRSNHYHYTDWHYMYVLEGEFDYYYRKTGTNDALKVKKFIKGDLVFTPPMEDHATIFIQNTILIVMSRNPRDQETYERDTVRIELINSVTLKENVKR